LPSGLSQSPSRISAIKGAGGVADATGGALATADTLAEALPTLEALATLEALSGFAEASVAFAGGAEVACELSPPSFEQADRPSPSAAVSEARIEKVTTARISRSVYQTARDPAQLAATHNSAARSTVRRAAFRSKSPKASWRGRDTLRRAMNDVSREPSEALRRTLAGITGEPLVILLTGHPDPDAIGSALAHQRICESEGVPATIAHVLPISHRENRALVKLLNIEMMEVSSTAELARFKYLSLVDTSVPEPSIDLPEGLKLISVVDHHRGPGKVDAAFVDIRPVIGASCSIYASYLQSGLAPLTGERRDDARVATALVFGIQTDTDDFALATADDFRAAAYAKTYTDADVLKRVGRRTVSASAMGVLGQALANLVVVRDFALAGVGNVPVGDRDAIGGAADYILRREDIDTVLVYGIVDDRIDGSLRTNSPSVDPATFLQTAFGRDRDGRPYGGGRADKGGFQIPLGLLADCEDGDALWRLVQQTVVSRLARVVTDLAPKRDRRKADRGDRDDD
jgi:nanoRNase/pAp phosphatase (c-di-AMP/oligoRNAs hydrolase)